MNNTTQQLRNDRLGDYAAGGEGHRNKPTTKDKMSNKLRNAADKMHNTIYEKTNPKHPAHASEQQKHGNHHHIHHGKENQGLSQQEQYNSSNQGQYENRPTQEHDSAYAQNQIPSPNLPINNQSYDAGESNGFYQGRNNTNGAPI